MSHIEKERLIKADIASIENRVRHAFNQGYDLGYKEGKANCSKIPTGSTTKNDLAVDAVSRDEVCRYVAEFVNHEFSTREEEELIDNIITGIERMPSVTPQSRKGHWRKTSKAVMGEGYMWYCDKCNHEVYQDSSRSYPSENFCPNCGSDNREVEE